MGQHTDYTWVITMDIFPVDVTNPSIKVGPSGAVNRAPLSEVIKRGDRFRMLDASGEPQVAGYILGTYVGNEPLTDYGSKYGCVEIQYERDGAWVTF